MYKVEGEKKSGGGGRKGHTMPVSADRCCDWKKTASGSRQLGHSLFERGS